MASRKSKGPNGERGGRLMKAMMCEANRKEDRMCGKQMERRQPSGRGTMRSLSTLSMALSEVAGDARAFGGERGTFLLSPQCHLCHWALHGKAGRNRRVFESHTVPHLILLHPFWCRTFSAMTQGRALWVRWVGSLDLLFLPGILSRGTGQPATLHYESIFPRLPFSFDKCYSSHFSLLILPAFEVLQLCRKSWSWWVSSAFCLTKQSPDFWLVSLLGIKANSIGWVCPLPTATRDRTWG